MIHAVMPEHVEWQLVLSALRESAVQVRVSSSLQEHHVGVPVESVT